MLTYIIIFLRLFGKLWHIRYTVAHFTEWVILTYLVNTTEKVW